MIRTAEKVKLNVLPVVFTCEHLYYYEGPCRFGKGDALQPGYDRLANAQKERGFLESLEGCLPEGVNLQEPVHFGRTDDWDDSEEQWEAMAPAIRNADFLVVMSGIACDDLVLELAQRFAIPMAVAPISGFQGSIAVATISACAAKDRLEVYGPCTWEDMGYILKIARARKIINTTQILCVSRYGNARSYSSLDTFNNHDEITAKLGVRFRYKNLHEIFDQMTPAVEGGNSTTPGRITPDLTEEDLEKAKAIMQELCDDAVENEMTEELMLPSCIAYVMTLKNMDLMDCNAFTIPCPDACSTRRLNEGKFTYCLTHSLNMESGIPSACEYDAAAALSQQALIAVSGMRPYMGNTCPIPVDGGKLQGRFGSTPEQIEELAKKGTDNLYMMQHSVAHRRLADPSKKAPIAIRPFAYDQKFGVTMRYDFDADEGKKITICRFSPDGSKLFIGSGTIVMGGGYDGYNCSEMVYFRVEDAKDTWEKQCLAGNHVTMVYGDYVQELIDLAKSLGVEPVVAR